MIFYHAEGSCSEGILTLLKLTGAAFETRIIRLAENDQQKPEFLAVNPKGKVPALQLASGEVVSEYPVISQYLAETFPEAGLLPRDPAARREALSLVEYIISTLHMRGASFVFRPARFTAHEAAHADLAAHGRAIVTEGLARLSARLGEADWFFDRPGVVEAAVSFIAAWTPRLGVALPDNLAALQRRLAALQA